MKTLQHLKQNFCALLTILWICSIAGCRNFKDYRTPYKSFVQVALQPRNKGDKLTITNIDIFKKRIEGDEPGQCTVQRSPKQYISSLFLDHNATSVEVAISYNGADGPLTTWLRIDYQKEAVLISPQCGCLYKYTLEKIEIIKGSGEYKIINKELSRFNDSEIDVQLYL